MKKIFDLKGKWRRLALQIPSLALVVPLAFGSLFVAQSLALADTTTMVTSSIQDSSSAPVASSTIGTSVHDVVTVASSTDASTTPTGNVDFMLYLNTTCSGTPTTQSGVALVNGVADSATTTVPNTGLSYTAHYDGDASNTAADSNCGSVSAVSSSTAVATVLSTSTASVGSSVYDSATLSGTTANATGSVAYNIYSDNACTASVQSAGVEPVVNGIVANSPLVQFNATGTYYWQASYSGDNSNPSASSSCQGEILTITGSSSVGTTTPVLATTTLATMLSTSTASVGSSVFDTATLGGNTAAASGTVAYNVFSDNACTANLQSAGTEQVTNGIIPNSSVLQFNATGTYYWQAAYSGDGSNTPSMSPCQSEILSIGGAPTVGTTTGTSTTPGTLSISGTVYNDLNRSGVLDANEPHLSGWTINLYDNAGWSGPTNIQPFMTSISDANGNYSFTNLAPGTYSIEEINQPHGLNQFTSDYSPVILASTSLSNMNFGNVMGNPYTTSGNNNGNHGNNGNGGNNNGNKGDNDHDKDDHGGNHGTSSKGSTGKFFGDIKSFVKNIGGHR